MTRLQADLSHPLTFLEWQPRTVINEATPIPRTFLLDGKLYITGKTSPNIQVFSSVSISQARVGARAYGQICVSVYHSALANFGGKLVMIGGRNSTSEPANNKLLSRQVGGTWTNELPSMPTRRYGATALTHGNHLLVAGGGGLVRVGSAVEVFDGEGWSRAESLPKEGQDMSSAVLDGVWYLMGGTLGRSVFSANLRALIASATGEEVGTVWKTLPEVPLEMSCAAVLGSRLLAIGGLQEHPPNIVACNQDIKEGSTSICAFVPPSWVEVADLPEPVHSACAAVLTTGELAVAGRYGGKSRTYVHYACLRVDSFPGGKLSLRALEHLQHTAKINLFRSIGAEWQHFAELPEVGLNIETQLQLPTSSEEYGRVVVKSWLENHGSTATWRSLLQLLESSKQLQIVASMIEQFFSAYSNMAALEERVYHLEQSQEEVLRREKVTLQIQEEVLQREKEATQKQVMTTNEIEELKSRLEIVEPLLQDLKEMEGRGKERENLVAEGDKLVAERDSLVAERDSLVAERDAARAERDELKAQLAEMHQKTACTVDEDRGVGELTDHEGTDSVPSLLSPPEPRKTIPAGPIAPASKRRTEDDNGDAESHPRKRQRSQEVKHVDDSRGASATGGDGGDAAGGSANLSLTQHFHVVGPLETLLQPKDISGEPK